MFTSAADLTQAITRWAKHWNTDPKPFIWKATADEIIEKGLPRSNNPPPDQISDGPPLGFAEEKLIRGIFLRSLRTNGRTEAVAAV